MPAAVSDELVELAARAVPVMNWRTDGEPDVLTSQQMAVAYAVLSAVASAGYEIVRKAS